MPAPSLGVLKAHPDKALSSLRCPGAGPALGRRLHWRPPVLLVSRCINNAGLRAPLHSWCFPPASVALTTYFFSPVQGIIRCFRVNLWIGSNAAFTRTVAGSRCAPGRLLGFHSLGKSKSLLSPCVVCAFRVFYPTKACISNKFLLNLDY